MMIDGREDENGALLTIIRDDAGRQGNGGLNQ